VSLYLVSGYLGLERPAFWDLPVTKTVARLTTVTPPITVAATSNPLRRA